MIDSGYMYHTICCHLLQLQGGGDFIFDVRCSGQIIVNPTPGLISKWIDPVSIDCYSGASLLRS